MKKYLWLFLIVLVSPMLQAQQYPYKLNGFLGIKGGESFTYELQLKDSTATILTGYAYTYLHKGKDVKAEIIATIDRANKKISIQELNILHNNGFTSKAVICLLHANLEYSPIEEALLGKLQTKTSGVGALPCSDGTITFLNKFDIETLFQTSQPAPNVSVVKESKPNKPALNPNQKVVDQETQKQDSLRKAQYYATLKNAPPKPLEITEGKDKTIEWSGNKVVLEVWDGNQEDGDKITIELNGREVLSNYTLRNKKHTLTLDISNSELNFINIIALNEGGDPPNTANIMLYDGEKSYEIIAHNHAEKKATIKILRKINMP